MQRYYYTVEVTNTFKDTVSVCVEAEHAGVARKLIRSAMEQYPDKVSGDSVKHCFIENRDKVSTDVTNITRTIGKPVDEIA